tara:strand:- start:7864 stop:9294 length:1431 start_codon:yes stop_codon:yes gene_type:complete
MDTQLSTQGALPAAQQPLFTTNEQQAASPKCQYEANAPADPQAAETPLVERKSIASPSLRQQLSDAIDQGLFINFKFFGPSSSWALRTDHPLFIEFKDDFLERVDFSRIEKISIWDTNCDYILEGDEAAEYIKEAGEFLFYEGVASPNYFDLPLKLLKSPHLTPEERRFTLLMQTTAFVHSQKQTGTFLYNLYESILDLGLPPQWHNLYLRYFADDMHHHPYLFEGVDSLKTLEGRIKKIDALHDALAKAGGLNKEKPFPLQANAICEPSVYRDFTCRNRNPEVSRKAYEDYYNFAKEDLLKEVDAGLRQELIQAELLYGSYQVHYEGSPLEENALLKEALKRMCGEHVSTEDKDLFFEYVKMLNALREGSIEDDKVLAYYEKVLSASAPKEPSFLTKNKEESGKRVTQMPSLMLSMAFCIAPTRSALAVKLMEKLVAWDKDDFTAEEALGDFQETPQGPYRTLALEDLNLESLRS